jgi:hypothetical protein
METDWLESVIMVLWYEDSKSLGLASSLLKFVSQGGKLFSSLIGAYLGE